MREISLNTSHSEYAKELESFIRLNSGDADIFCLQEMSQEKLKTYSGLLSNFHMLCIQKPCDGDDAYRLGVFVREPLKVVDSGTILTDPSVGASFFVKIQHRDSCLTIVNVHGVCEPGNKVDTEDRLKQSETILKYLESIQGQKIVAGDFNLMPDTKSVKMFEEAGYRNLVSDFSIKSTRNRIAWEKFENHPGFFRQHFADYVFVSPGVIVKNFEVPYMEVSDHLPMFLDFEI